MWLAAACAIVAASATPLAAGAQQGVTIDAKGAKLSLVLDLLAAQGCPRLRLHPDLADREVTFAAKALSPAAAVRWLCRVCRLVVTRGADGGALVTQPSLQPASVQRYRVSRLAPTAETGQALIGFIRSVIFAACQHREPDEAGELKPSLGARWEDGRLSTLAPRSVQREVLALLQAMARAKQAGQVEAVRVRYAPYELGLLAPDTGPEPPPMKARVTLDLADASAAEAAWAMTSQGNVSFFADPWDDGLEKAKVTFKAEDRPLVLAAGDLAKHLGAELQRYDGAWVFVRSARKPLFEGLVVQVYNVSGSFFGRAFAAIVERQAKRLALPADLPYGVARVGDRVLAAVPGAMHQDLAEIVRRTMQGPRRPWADHIRRRWGKGRK